MAAAPSAPAAAAPASAASGSLALEVLEEDAGVRLVFNRSKLTRCRGWVGQPLPPDVVRRLDSGPAPSAAAYLDPMHVGLGALLADGGGAVAAPAPIAISRAGAEAGMQAASHIEDRAYKRRRADRAEAAKLKGPIGLRAAASGAAGGDDESDSSDDGLAGGRGGR